MLGQEKHSTAKLRTMGTIESLLLLSDWHPRAIHLPPETEGWDAFLVSPAYDRVGRRRHGDETPMIRWREDVFEPVTRADRMTWMLLGLVSNLGYELEIFSAQEDQRMNPTPDQQRKHRLSITMVTCIVQTSVRLGYPNVLPESVAQLSSNGVKYGGTGLSGKAWSRHLSLWTDLIQLAKAARAMFFQPSSERKFKVLGSQYDTLLGHLSKSLAKWHEDFIHQQFGKFARASYVYSALMQFSKTSRSLPSYYYYWITTT